MWLILILAFLLLFSRLFHLTDNAYRITVYIYFSLIFYSLWLIVSNLKFFNKYNNVLGFIKISCINIVKKTDRKKSAALILLVSLIAGLSDYYYLGGDDSKLYFLYPELFLNNYASQVLPGQSLSGMTGFLPSLSIFYFTSFLNLFKQILPFINLQSFLYTANLLFGMYFFYILLSYLNSERKHNKFIYFTAAFFYVFSIFNIYILFNARLIAIFLVSIFPLSLYLFFRSVKENKTYLVLIISLLWSVFAFVSAASLWFLATLLITFPLILYFMKDNLLRAFNNVLLLGISLIVLNMFWLYYLPFTTLMNKDAGVTNSIVSHAFVNENANGIRANGETNELFYPINNLFHYKIQDNNKWPFLGVFKAWYLNLIPLTSIFILLIISAAIIRRNNSLGDLYKISLIQLLLSLYFFTLNLGNTTLGNWGVEFFVWLNNHVPGFVAFRNNYDKFGYSLSFAFAFAFGVSMSVINETKVSEKFVRMFTTGAFLTSALIAFPFLSGTLSNLPVWKTNSTYYTTKELNKDYLELTEYIANQADVGRYLTLPISRGNIAFIEDESLNNHYFVGVSPLRILSGKNDYSGSLSIGRFEREMNEFFTDGDINKLGDLLRQANTKYVITNNTITPDMRNNYLLGNGIYELQNEYFLDNITGEKIKDFGGRYSLYKINDKLQNEKIFLFNEENGTKGRIEVIKISDSEYKVTLSEWNQNDKLVFLEPFFDEWEIVGVNGETMAQGGNQLFNNWANSWVLNMPENDKRPVELRLQFTPTKAKAPLMTLSITAFVGISVYVLFKSFKKQNA